MRQIQEYKNRWGKVWPFFLIGTLVVILWSRTSGKIATVIFLLVLAGLFYISLK